MNIAKAFGEVLGAILAIYRQPPPTDSVLNVWIDSLRNNKISFEVAIAALQKYARTPDNKFPPTPSDIACMVLGGAKDVEALAIQAWEMALEGLRKGGCYPDMIFSDRVIHSTIKMLGGWPTFCSMENDEMRVMRIDFIKAYAVAYALPHHPNRLMGMPGENGVRLIGDLDICRLMLADVKAERAALAAPVENKPLPITGVKSL